jgi:capsular exopolysaccharide synthesis family protein
VDNRRLWSAVRSRWFVVAVLALVGIAVAGAYVLVTKPQYSANAQLYVSAIGSDNPTDLAQGGNYAQQQARDYSNIATKQIVLSPVISTLGLKTTVSKLGDRVAASVPLNTSIISLQVTDTSPDRAAATANAVATSLVNAVVKIAPERSDGTTPISLEIVQHATVPSSPDAPNAKIALLLGLLAGLILGVIVVVLRELATIPVRDSEQVAHITGAPILGTVVQDGAAVTHPLVAQRGIGAFRAEQYRQIRTELSSLRDTTSTFVFTSAVPDEGKSVTAANVAIAFAAAGQTVCLVDANLRAPSLHRLFEVEVATGVADVLAGRATLDSAVQKWGDTSLSLLLASESTPSSSELLSSVTAGKVFASMMDKYDILVIDTPSLLPATDAAILADQFGGAIVVARAGKVKARELRIATDMVTSRGTPVLGVILNRVPALTFRGLRHAYTPARKTEEPSTV